MNGPAAIYRLKPVFELPKILDLPECMYSMKSPVACVTKTTDRTDDEKEVLAGIMDKKPLPELTSLQARWDSILEQLSNLKLQMTTIRKTVSDSCKLAGYPMLDKTALESFKNLQGIVINASPSNPPYSLLLLKHLYESTVPIFFDIHIHSTVLSLPESAKCFSDSIPSTDNFLKLHLIWKNDILDTELVTNPVKQIPIKGEVNVLRFFARSGLKLLRYSPDELLNSINTDSILDLSHRLLHVKASKERTSLFKSLNAKLGRSPYFGGEEMNISDISAWSALKQINANTSQDLTPTLAKWYNKLDKILF